MDGDNREWGAQSQPGLLQKSQSCEPFVFLLFILKGFRLQFPMCSDSACPQITGISVSLILWSVWGVVVGAWGWLFVF